MTDGRGRKGRPRSSLEPHISLSMSIYIYSFLFYLLDVLESIGEAILFYFVGVCGADIYVNSFYVYKSHDAYNLIIIYFLFID